MQYLLPIRDLILAAQLDESVSWAIRDLVKNRLTIELVLFKLPGWNAVPIEPDILINPSSRERIVTALQGMGYKQLYAVLLFSPIFDSYLVPVTVEGLDELGRCLGWGHFALFAGEEKPDWMWISIESEMYIVAGTREFIEQLLSWSIEEAFSHFHNFMVNEIMPRNLRQLLEFVVDQISHYQDADEGEEFYLSRLQFR